MLIANDRCREMQIHARRSVVQLPPPPPTFSREAAMNVALRSFSEGGPPPLLVPNIPSRRKEVCISLISILIFQSNSRRQAVTRSSLTLPFSSPHESYSLRRNFNRSKYTNRSSLQTAIRPGDNSPVESEESKRKPLN